MIYTIILPNTKEVIIEADSLRFDLDSTLTIFGIKEGHTEELLGIFPKESGLVVVSTKESEYLSEIEGLKMYAKEWRYKFEDMKDKFDIATIDAKNLERLKSLSLFDRIFRWKY